MKLLEFVIVMVVTMLIGALLVDIGNSTSNTKTFKKECMKLAGTTVHSGKEWVCLR